MGEWDTNPGSENDMAGGYGKGSTGSDAMNQHKAMAGAGMKGSFGVTEYPGRVAKHPDIGMSHEAMADSARSPASPGKGFPMMGAPDHGMGKGHPDHFDRGGKV